MLTEMPRLIISENPPINIWIGILKPRLMSIEIVVNKRLRNFIKNRYRHLAYLRLTNLIISNRFKFISSLYNIILGVFKIHSLHWHIHRHDYVWDQVWKLSGHLVWAILKQLYKLFMFIIYLFILWTLNSKYFRLLKSTLIYTVRWLRLISIVKFIMRQIKSQSRCPRGKFFLFFHLLSSQSFICFLLTISYVLYLY